MRYRRPTPSGSVAPLRPANCSRTDREVFAPLRVLAYIRPVSKYSPLISEFGSAEEEAAYNEWFRKKIEASLADPRPSIPHDEVMAEIDALLEAKRAKRAAPKS